MFLETPLCGHECHAKCRWHVLKGRAAWLLFAVSLFAVAPEKAVGTRLDLVKLDLNRYPLARCADGSPAGYYFKPATSEAGRRLFIFYLQSGGWCWSPESCLERCTNSRDFCSSDNWEEQIELHGVMSEDVPVAGGQRSSLMSANKVYVRYCTSDGHMGNAEAFGYQFRGQKVVEGALQEMVRLHGMGSAAFRAQEANGGSGGPDLLLFGGGSAGARGAMVHLDYVLEMIGEAAAQNVVVKGLLDSPLWLNIDPYDTADPNFHGFGNQTAQVHSYANVTHLGAECASRYIVSEQWKCMFGQYRMPTLRTPWFLVAATFDYFQLSWNLGTGDIDKMTPKMLEYATTFAQKTAELVGSLSSPEHVGYAPACLSHATSLEDKGYFVNEAGSGTSLYVALTNFLGLHARDDGSLQSSSSIGQKSTNGNTHKYKYIDTCTEVDCGAGCHRRREADLCRGGSLYGSFRCPNRKWILDVFPGCAGCMAKLPAVIFSLLIVGMSLV